MSDVQRFADKVALGQGAAARFVALAQAAVAEHGRFSVALSGGSTPRVVHKALLNDYRDQVDWSKVYFFWGDERTVSPEHEESNYRMARETLLEHVPASHVYRMEAERDPQEAAKHYEDTLRAFFNSAWPRFDLIFLGMGEDGHTASLFPETAALDEAERWVVANHVPTLDTWRITLTASAINQAANIIFLVAGAGKADTLREVVNGPYLPHQFPAQMIEPVNGTLTWMVDEAAAEFI